MHHAPISLSMRDRLRTVRLGYEQRMQGLASLSSVSLEQFDAAWKISLDIDHHPARTCWKACCRKWD